MRILLAEDEITMAEPITAFLQYHKYTVDWVDNGEDAYYQASSQVYDGLILDIMMPGMDGLQVLSRLRGEGRNMPVLLLTAKAEVEDRIKGFDSGADDYLPKPFAIGELLARVRAMLRRREEFTPNVIVCGDLALNQQSAELRCGEKTAVLPKLEYRLMELLMLNRGICLSTEDILVKVWGYETEADIGVVWVYISYLRKRLAALGSAVEIKARRGVGYTLEAPQ